MMRITRKKTVLTILLVLLVMLILVPPFYRAVFEAAPFRTADRAGVAYVDEAFNRALIAFALARATNAVISVVQDSELDIAPAGIGVTIAMGEALDPINDLIERFSWVMLVSLVSLGIQKLLIDISPWVSIKLLLLPAAGMFLVSLWTRENWSQRLRYYGRRLVFLTVLVRFCIPVVAMVNEQVFELFLDRHYSAAVAGMEHGNAALREMDPLAEEMLEGKQTGFWGELRKKAEDIGEAVDLRQRIDRMKSRLAGMIEDLLQMIAVFLLNTIVLPIGFLWLLVRLFRLFVGNESLQRIEQLLVARMTGEPGTKLASEASGPGGNRSDIEVDEEDKDIERDQ